MANFVMPKLGADMAAGILIAWHKKPGDAVKRGEVVAEVETDKGVIDVEIFTDGVMESEVVHPGEKVPVGTVLATIREEKSVAPTAVVEAPPTAPKVPQVSPATAAPVPHAEGDRVRISPSARNLAEELHVDVSKIQGTGPRGVITREDIQRAASAAKPAPTSPAERAARMRQAIAAAMSRSKREIPHYYLGTTIDLDRALTWLKAENEKRSVTERILYGVLLFKAVALALREFPEMNGFWADDHFQASKAIHLGVAISMRQGGLITPAIHDADQLTLGDLMEKLRDLVQRTRAGSLRSSELSDSTITVTNLGEQGVESVYPIIYPPQVAIVGFGKVVDRPWVVGGQVVARPVVTATLAADHRVSDGHRGALFLAAVDRLLQEPEKL